MSLRSALLAIFLLTALAAAYWPDLFTAKWYNLTVTKICAIDAPSKCYYVPKPPFDVGKYTYTIAVYKYGSSIYNVYDDMDNYLMLNYIVYSNSPSWYVINITKPGLLYTTSGSFTVKSGSTATTSSTYVVCGKTYNYAVYIQTPGLYNVTPFKPPHYLVDPSTCREYRISATSNLVDNSTIMWFGLYVAELLPVTKKIYYSNGNYVLNGTEHAYFTRFFDYVAPAGAGFYIAGGTALPTLMVIPSGGDYMYGPRHYSALQNSSVAIAGLRRVYTIGQSPGDGAFLVSLPNVNVPFELTFLSTNMSGYVTTVSDSGTSSGVIIYATRYDVVEVTVRDAASYLYNVRGIACPGYTTIGTPTWKINRIDRLGEIEVCNNRTSTVYVALIYNSYNTYGDVIQPGKCAKLRWDTATSSNPILYVYGSARDLCSKQNAILATSSISSGWRYFLFSNNTLKAAAPLSPDYDYASAWLQLLNYTRQMYNNLTKAYSAWLNATIAASKTAANASLSNFLATLPKASITIKMDESTSTWLKTTLNVLKTYQVTGPTVGGAVSVSLQAPSAFTASAAAAAVATAWAASRKSLAVAAFLAGFAVLATSLFVYYLYGASVTAGLILAAVALMSIGAAAAWFRKTED